MEKEHLDNLKDWFTDFVRGHYSNGDDFLNENVHLKECHTHRVCNEMRQLSLALGMNDSDALLAETIALLHDVGRFPQFKQYRTYKDQISENHCLLALKVLNEHDMLACLTNDEKVVVEKAIEFHGTKDIPEMDERSSHFTKMIRDADKIDIYQLLIENYCILAGEPEKFKWELEYPDTPECNPEIIQLIMSNQLIGYDLLGTINDAKLLQLGWVFNIYFDWTLKEIHERGYLQAIIDLLPETEEVIKVTDYILQYVNDRIGKDKTDNW